MPSGKCLLLLCAVAFLATNQADARVRRYWTNGINSGFGQPAQPARPSAAPARPVREHVPNDRLPEDGGRLYATLYTSPIQTEKQEIALANWTFDESLTAYLAQTHVSRWNIDDPALTESHRSQIGDVLPAVCIIDSYAEVIYLARGDEIPDDPAALLAAIHAAEDAYAAKHQADGKLSPVMQARADQMEAARSAGMSVTLASNAVAANPAANNPVAGRPYLYPWNVPNRPNPNPNDKPCPDCGPDNNRVPHVVGPRVDARVTLPHRSVGVQVATSNGANVPTIVAGAVTAFVVVLLVGLAVWFATKIFG